MHMHTLYRSVDWREPGKYKYRKNEVYIDVFEAVIHTHKLTSTHPHIQARGAKTHQNTNTLSQVNLLMSNKGVVLKSDVSGKIIMKVCFSLHSVTLFQLSLSPSLYLSLYLYLSFFLSLTLSLTHTVLM